MKNIPSPRANAILTGCVGGLLVEQLVRTALNNRRTIMAHPQILAWMGLSTAIGTSLLYLNGRGIKLRGTVLSCLGYGAAGTLFGFAVQRSVNGPLDRALGPAAHSVAGSLLLGLGAAGSQTLGKTVMALKFRKVFAEDRNRGLAVGLSIGLGFGLAELIIISINAIPNAAYVNLMGGVERCSAMGFHIYSGGLIGLAFIEKKYGLIGLVVILHTIMDGLGPLLAAYNLLLAELLFIVGAAIVWYIWRIRSKKGAETEKVLAQENHPHAA
jgi:hypothetical protein